MEKIRNAAADEEVCGLKRKARCKVAIDQQETERGLSLALMRTGEDTLSQWGEKIRLIKEESLVLWAMRTRTREQAVAHAKLCKKPKECVFASRTSVASHRSIPPHRLSLEQIDR